MPSIIAGLGDGVLLFLIASGLSVIFGAMRFLNFAHGAFFAVGAYLTVQLLSVGMPTIVTFILAAVFGGICVAVLALTSEVLVFRKLYKLPPIDSFLGTYALLLLLEGVILLVWGPNSQSISYPQGLNGMVSILGIDIPAYAGLLILVGILVVIVMTLVLYRTRFGLEIRGLAEDRTMTQLLGVSVTKTSAKVMLVGGALAGLGGALATPTIAVTPDLASTYIIQAFAVIVVGGLGSFYGALVASVLLAVTQSLVVIFVPELSGIAFYAAMFIVLIVRPQGLFGKSRLEIA